MIFTGIGYKFNDFIQAIHRIYRFLQGHQCEIHIIYTEAERDVLKVLNEKWTQHNHMVENMTDIIRNYGEVVEGGKGLRLDPTTMMVKEA